MHGPEFLIPIFFFLTCASVAAVLMLTRHRERMTIIEKGLPSEEIKAMYARRSSAPNALVSLKWGILLMGVGLGVVVGIRLHEANDFSGGIIPGLMCLFGGLGLIIFYIIARTKTDTQS